MSAVLEAKQGKHRKASRAHQGEVHQLLPHGGVRGGAGDHVRHHQLGGPALRAHQCEPENCKLNQDSTIFETAEVKLVLDTVRFAGLQL